MKLKQFGKKFLISMICVGMLMPQVPARENVKAAEANPEQPAGGAHGSGSYQLNSVDNDYRFYTEYYVDAKSDKKYTTAGIDRRTTIQVYAKKDEMILFGSSVSDSYIDEDNKIQSVETGADIVITTPKLKSDDQIHKIGFDVIAEGKTDKKGNYRKFGYGYIANHTQEKNGPMVNQAEESAALAAGKSDYYVPITYQVPQDGIYTFEFHSTKGKNEGQTVTRKKAKDAWDQKDIAVAAWDVTVLGKNKSDTSKWEVKDGRAWTNYLALTTGAANDTESDLNVHVLTHDGYVYKVNFKKAVPFGFIFFANNTGFMTEVKDSDGQVKNRVPIYHSFYDSTNDLDNIANEKIVLHKPNEADTSTEETYKIFFNAPSKDLQGVVDPNNGSAIKVEPDSPVAITNLKFQGIGEASGTSAIARVGQGGLFTFHASGEATVTIRLDLRNAVYDSKLKDEEYEGSGFVELTAFAEAGDNSFYWDGKDTEGVTIPAGIYGDQNVVISTEVKRGELHFPVIDMEGLRGGLTIERLNKGSQIVEDNGAQVEKGETEAHFNETKYDLYYNNNPLAYGTIEGKYPKVEATLDGKKYNLLTDGTRSFNIATTAGGWSFFKDYTGNISTLVKDDSDYIAEKIFKKKFADLDADSQKMIEDELRNGKETFHFQAVDSRTTTMLFGNGGSSGGGNQAGIDAWTYYSQGVNESIISFAMLDNQNTGIIGGQIFYDNNKDSQYTTGAEDTSGDYVLPNVKVRLMQIVDGVAKPATHSENLPVFDDYGHFVYETDGSVKHENRTVTFDTVTDSKGIYRFVGVPYSTTEDTEYYVQVLLSDAQTEVLRYTCTTSDWVKDALESSVDGTKFHDNVIDATNYGPDGCKMEIPLDENIAKSKIYKYKYSRDGNETVFDLGNASNLQKVTFSASTEDASLNGVRKVKFASIGYCSAVPAANQWNYTVKKDWGATHQISDGLTVELWVWNDTAVQKENTKLDLSRRTGALVDTQVLNAADGWTYTWKNLDNRLQYYVLEYYTKKKDNGDVIYNDHGEPRMVLIGGTMPIYGEVPSGKMPSYDDTLGAYTQGIYGFATNLGDYPGKVKYYNSGKNQIEDRIPIQYFSENNAENPANPISHTNSITEIEKIESVDNNARQYKVTYTLAADDGTKTNTITLKNEQVYDDRTYYVWLNHETELPNMIGKSFVTTKTSGEHVLDRHAIALVPDGAIDGATGAYNQRIKGLSVSSVDAANNANSEGNATDAFRIKASASDAEKASAFFTATEHGNYKSGTGTRTYKVKYVVDGSDNPVSVRANEAGKLVTNVGGTETLVEGSNSFTVYSWYMTIHVYNVVPDEVIEYDPAGGTINLQTALDKGHELAWELKHDSEVDKYAVTYKAKNDTRTGGILTNDIYRVPLYKDAVDPDMGTCADVVGIAYAPNCTNPEAVDGMKLDYADTYASRFGVSLMSEDEEEDSEDEENASAARDGLAEAVGSGGIVSIQLNTTRDTHINRTQDHANYADVTFTPQKSKARAASREDVFFYKVVVLSEDSTYQFTNYDEIDASDGVVMYTYFTMKSTAEEPDDDDQEETEAPSQPSDDNGDSPDDGQEESQPDDENGASSGDDTGMSTPPQSGGEDTSNSKYGVKNPFTGDVGNFTLWIALVALGIVMITFGVVIIRKRNSKS